ncbi:succinylglutamate desuccinylase/aspartoacylase family protein [Myxococcota bacterium]|nr:succinylglutamate desuccinylase/aspartoacylase family protein [Myxococcota bacterium]
MVELRSGRIPRRGAWRAGLGLVALCLGLTGPRFADAQAAGPGATLPEAATPATPATAPTVSPAISPATAPAAPPKPSPQPNPPQNPSPTASETTNAGATEAADASTPGIPGEADATGAVPAPIVVPDPIRLLDGEVVAGTRAKLGWHASNEVAGLQADTPVLVAHGRSPGPVLCLTSAIHGDELNGIEIVRRVYHSIDPDTLSGTLIGVPVVNLVGFQRASRYLPDRRDLNRFFPGNPRGSLASRVAYSFFESVIRHCDYLVDLHTGSFHRTNLPQLRADLSDPRILAMTKGFGAIAVLHSNDRDRSLRSAASRAGIAAVTIEAGEPMRLQPEEVEQGVRAIESLMDSLGMISRFHLWVDPQPVFYESIWVRTSGSGILLGAVEVGDRVEIGQTLGAVVDPVTNARDTLKSPVRGRVLGKALNQIVMPGFAAYRVGIEQRQEDLSVEPTVGEGDTHDEDAYDPLQLEGIDPALEPEDVE